MPQGKQNLVVGNLTNVQRLDICREKDRNSRITQTALAVWTKDHTLIRKASVLKGLSASPSSFIVSAEWDSLPKNTWTNLGVHTCNCTLGLNEFISSPSFSIFPNPSVDGMFTIFSEEFIVKIEISDLIGQIVSTKSLNNFIKSTDIDAANLEKGLYVVKIKYANNLESKSTVVIQ